MLDVDLDLVDLQAHLNLDHVTCQGNNLLGLHGNVHVRRRLQVELDIHRTAARAHLWCDGDDIRQLVDVPGQTPSDRVRQSLLPRYRMPS